MAEITQFPNTEQDDLVASIEKLKRILPQLKEQSEIIADIRKSYYDAHINAGFSEEQAIELCKSI